MSILTPKIIMLKYAQLSMGTSIINDMDLTRSVHILPWSYNEAVQDNNIIYCIQLKAIGGA